MESIAPVFVKNNDLQSQNVSDFEMCTEVAKQVGGSNLRGCQRIKGLWRIYLKSDDSRVRLITEKLTLRNQAVPVYSDNPFRARLTSPDDKVTKITVKDIPLSKGNSSLESYLESQGVKLKGPIQYGQARDPVTKTLSDWENGDRLVYAEELQSPLPRFVKIGTTSARIFHFGQPPTPKLCTKCFSKEHTRGQCKEQQACRRCRKPGHEPGDTRCEASTAAPLENVTAFSGKKDELSNFYPCELDVFGKQFKSAEQAYQYSKAVHQGQLDIAKEILNCKDAYEAKAQARSLQYNKEWQEVKVQKMKEILSNKASQVPEFTNKLLDTKDDIIVESTTDRFWGSGLDKMDTVYTKRRFWPGRNNLGSILEEIRQELVVNEQVVKPKHSSNRRQQKQRQQQQQRQQGVATRSTASQLYSETEADGYDST